MVLCVATYFAYATAQSHLHPVVIQKIDGVRVRPLSDMLAYNLTRAGFTILIACSLILLIGPAILRWIVKRFGSHTALRFLSSPIAQQFARYSTEKTWLWFPLAVLCNASLEKLGKTFLDWNRPGGERNGFPSGHAMFAFMLAFLVSEKYPKLAPIFYGVAVAIGWARVEAGAHYPYQVLGGAFIGTVIAWTISHFVKAPIEDETRVEIAAK